MVMKYTCALKEALGIRMQLTLGNASGLIHSILQILLRTSTPVKISPLVVVMALMSTEMDLSTSERDIPIRKNICMELLMIGLLRETACGVLVRYPAFRETPASQK